MNVGGDMEIFSFFIYSDFSAFRKFDENSNVDLTYLFPPKPSILGILGSIIGLPKSNSEELPWWEELKTIRIGISLEIRPSGLGRALVKYNNSQGYAYPTMGGTVQVTEQVNINPKYRIYVELNEKTLPIYELLKSGRVVFTPYMGRNHFRAVIEDVKRYDKAEELTEGNHKVSTIWPLCSLNKEASDLIEDIFVENYAYEYNDNYTYSTFPFIQYDGEVNLSVVKNTAKKHGIDISFFRLDSNLEDVKVVCLF